MGGETYSYSNGWRSVTGGGNGNYNNGRACTIPGGENNQSGTGASDSFVAGQRGNTNDPGTFVWSDSTTLAPNYFTSTGPNQFLINATGGVGINTDSPDPNSLTVNGVVHSLAGGFKLPDGTVIADAGDLGGSGWGLAGNSGTNPSTNFLGTTDNQALVVKVNGARAPRIEPNATAPNLIGGHASNAVTSGV